MQQLSPVFIYFFGGGRVGGGGGTAGGGGDDGVLLIKSNFSSSKYNLEQNCLRRFHAITLLKSVNLQTIQPQTEVKMELLSLKRITSSILWPLTLKNRKTRLDRARKNVLKWTD